MEDLCSNSISIKSDSGLAESYRPLVRSVPLLQCEICVIVPVRNEAKLLPACLKALAEQADLEGEALDFNR